MKQLLVKEIAPPVDLGYICASGWLRVRHCEIDGIEKMDFRLWFKSRMNDEPIPTAKGFFIPIDVWNREILPGLIQLNNDKAAA